MYKVELHVKVAMTVIEVICEAVDIRSSEVITFKSQGDLLIAENAVTLDFVFLADSMTVLRSEHQIDRVAIELIGNMVME